MVWKHRINSISLLYKYSPRVWLAKSTYFLRLEGGYFITILDDIQQTQFIFVFLNFSFQVRFI